MARINKFLNFSQKNPLLAKNVPLFVANLKFFTQSRQGSLPALKFTDMAIAGYSLMIR